MWLVFENPNTEVLRHASQTLPAPRLCHDDDCQAMTLHPRGAFSYAQICDSMRDATIEIFVEGTPLYVPLSLAEARPLSVAVLAQTERLTARVSAPIVRARAWTSANSGTDRDLDLELLAGGHLITARRPPGCDAPTCTTWIHAASLSGQERLGDVLIDRVDELVQEVP